ncbi:hypothetical protein P5673_001232, partial [Acropora cervicornis]
ALRFSRGFLVIQLHASALKRVSCLSIEEVNSLEVRENVIVTLCKWPPLAAQDVQLETENIAFRMWNRRPKKGS